MIPLLNIFSLPGSHSVMPSVEYLLLARIPFGDAAGDIDPVLAAELRQRGDEGPVRYRLRELAAMGRRVEQIACVHTLRKYDQIGALPDRLLDILRRQRDVVIEITKSGECLHGCGAKSALHHIDLQSLSSAISAPSLHDGCRRCCRSSLFRFLPKAFKAMALERHEAFP